MNKFVGIVVMAGTGDRFHSSKHKALIEVNQLPLFLYSVNAFLELEQCTSLILVIHPSDEREVQEALDIHHIDKAKIKLVFGGATRAESVRNGLQHALNSEYVVIHDAARPLLFSDDIVRIVESLNEADSATYYRPIYDTVKRITSAGVETLPRSELKAVSTPQAFKNTTFDAIMHPHYEDHLITDDIVLVEKSYVVKFIEESHSHIKITTQDDLKHFNQLKGIGPDSKIGHSFDFHVLVENRPLILGGLEIPYHLGLLGHSDADVVYHVVTESILGALGLGDIGTHFPDSDPKYKGMPSSNFVLYAKDKLLDAGYKIQNIDIIIYLEEPKLSKYKRKMAENISFLLSIDPSKVNVKATTMEKKGRIGKGEGIAAEAIVLIQGEEK